jgi:hypothetical protein
MRSQTRGFVFMLSLKADAAAEKGCNEESSTDTHKLRRSRKAEDVSAGNVH